MKHLLLVLLFALGGCVLPGATDIYGDDDDSAAVGDDDDTAGGDDDDSASGDDDDSAGGR